MKKTKLPPPPSPRVSSISVSRLYNLGNYENVKYEIGVEIPPGADPAKALMRLSVIIGRLRPLPIPRSAMQELQSILAKPRWKWTAYEKSAVVRCKEQLAKFEIVQKKRMEAVAQLKHLGGSVTEKDAKESWEDFEEVW